MFNNMPGKLWLRKKTGLYTAGRGFEAFFDPKRLIARSGTWPDSYTFLKRINGRLLITSCPGSYWHNEVKQLLKGKHKTTWVSVDCSLELFKTEGLKSRYEEFYKYEADLNLKGIRKATKDWHREHTKRLLKEIAWLRKLGAGFPVKERKKLQASEQARVAAANARYDERRKASRDTKREPDEAAVFKAELLNNSFRNV